MARIWTMGEILVEVMRRDVDKSFLEPDVFIGPFPSGPFLSILLQDLAERLELLEL